MKNQIGEELALKVFKLYHVGTSKHWEGATVFWQIDFTGKIRAGKIMLYNKETHERARIYGVLYNEIKIYDANNLNYTYRILKLLKNNQIDKFLRYYPEQIKYCSIVNKLIDKLSKTLLNLYYKTKKEQL